MAIVCQVFYRKMLERQVPPAGSAWAWCAEKTSYPNDVSEAALWHAVADKVEAAYRRGDLFEKRRRLMAEWAKYCSTPAAAKRGSVVPLRATV